MWARCINVKLFNHRPHGVVHDFCGGSQHSKKALKHHQRRFCDSSQKFGAASFTFADTWSNAGRLGIGDPGRLSSGFCLKSWILTDFPSNPTVKPVRTRKLWAQLLLPGLLSYGLHKINPSFFKSAHQVFRLPSASLGKIRPSPSAAAAHLGYTSDEFPRLDPQIDNTGAECSDQADLPFAWARPQNHCRRVSQWLGEIFSSALQCISVDLAHVLHNRPGNALQVFNGEVDGKNKEGYRREMEIEPTWYQNSQPRMRC